MSNNFNYKGENMKIEFTKKELKSLIELLYFADYMSCVSEDEYPEKIKNYEKILQKVRKIAFENGLDDYVEPFEKNEYVFSHGIEADEVINEIIDNYDNDNFWFMLASKLALRDVLDKMTPEEYFKLDDEKKFTIRLEQEEFYEREFSKYGIKYLRILNTDLSF